VSPVTIKTLGAGDEPALEAFLAGHRATSMFLRSNARAAGLVDRDAPGQGTYVAAFDGDAMIGVVGHFWNGMVLPQAPPALAETLARTAIAATGRRVLGISGALDQVEAAKRYLGLAALPAAIDEPEGLYTLALRELRVPPALASGELVGRLAELRWLDRLVAWRLAYVAETLGQPITAETPARVVGEMRRTVEHRSGFVVVAAAEPDVPLAYAGYNAELPDIVQIGGVWTPPAERGRGLARAVTAAALMAARDRGVTDAVLFTSNPAARRAYESLGFVEVGSYGLFLLMEPATIG
jgi:RimJ/RimL family protein N-acetyltransferase